MTQTSKSINSTESLDTDARPIRLAIAGFGNQGQEHFQACRANPELANVVAVCDPAKVEENLGNGIRCYRSLDNLFKTESIDAIIVATPPIHYRKVVTEAAKFQLPILLEKPLGLNLQEAGDLIDICDQNNSPLLLAAQRRFHPSFLRVSELLRDMAEVKSAELELMIAVQKNVTAQNTGQDWRCSVGAMLDLGFHAIDLGRLWFGELQLVSANVFDDRRQICRNRIDTEAHLLFKTEAGTLFRIRIGRTLHKSERLTVHGDGETLIANRGAVHRILNNEEFCESTCDPDWCVAMQAQLRELQKVCLGTACQSTTTLSSIQGLITMQLIEEAYDRSEYA